MRVLIVHSYYLQPGGEDAVFEQEAELLKQKNEVEVLSFRNEAGWKGALQFFISIWNFSAAHKLKRKIREFGPDIIHIHNWHFASGPIIIRTAKGKKIPVILTLHNYRLLCPSAILLFKGKIFTDSLYVTFPWKAIRNKVYRNSLFLTFWLAFIIWFHKKIGTWLMVDKYILLNEFAKEVFISSSFGIQKEKFLVKPNFVAIGPSLKNIQRNNHFLFVGRLSPEKGISVLLDALQQSDYTLQIVGDGPLKDEVLSACRENKNIKYLGSLGKAAVLQSMRECSALIFPSIWYEGMPMTLLESFATGTPVIASKLGAMKLMIQDTITGLHFEPGSSKLLKEQLDFWQRLHQNEKNKYTENCFSTYFSNYTPEKSGDRLINIYQEVLRSKH